MVPFRLHSVRLEQSGKVSVEDRGLAGIAGPAILIVSMVMMIGLSSGYLLQGVATERQNHVIDVILAYVSPGQFLAGKLLGLSAACLVVPLVFIVQLVLLAPIQMPAGDLACVVLVMLGGYAFTAALMVSIGLFLDVSKETNQMSLFWTVWSVIPVLVLATSQSWHSGLPMFLSYFQLTSPVALLVRISFGAVSRPELLAAFLALVVATFICIQVSSRVLGFMVSAGGPRADAIRLVLRAYGFAG